VNRLKPGFPPLRSGAKIEQIQTPRNSSTQIKPYNPDILTNKNQRRGEWEAFLWHLSRLKINIPKRLKPLGNSIYPISINYIVFIDRGRTMFSGRNTSSSSSGESRFCSRTNSYIPLPVRRASAANRVDFS